MLQFIVTKKWLNFYRCFRIVKAVDETLQLSKSTGMTVSDLGSGVVLFIFFLVWRLVDATCEDWGISMGRFDKQDKILQNQNSQSFGMEVDENLEDKRREECEQMRKANSIAAIDLVSKIMQNKKTGSLLRLARRNLLDQWNMFARCLQSLEALTHDASSTAPKGALEALRHLAGSMQQGFFQEWKPIQLPVVQVLLQTKSHSWPFGNCFGVGRTGAWLPIDLFMEDVMDGRRLPANSVVQTLAELVKSLRAVQHASWQDTFLALWISAVRLVQREWDHMEGPRPHSESRFCMLLCIVPLTSALVIEEEERQSMHSTSISESGCIGASDDKERKIFGNCRAAFISSLQILGQFEGLLSAHQLVAAAAHQAAATAVAYVAEYNGGSVSMEGLSASDGNSGIRTANLRHLIVEACIARGLIDKSAYFWPGYVGTLAGTLSLPASVQISPWKAYMDGASLTGSLKSALMTTPAGSLAELDRIYQAAVNGVEDERPAAASILCGATLMRGWNIQEHAVRLALSLLSPPSADARGGSHFLVPHAPVLHAALGGISSDDAIHILSLYGMFPELAAVLLPICEVFGSLSPSGPLVTGSGEEISVLTLFSLAFLILIKLWKFHRPPVEHRILGRGAPLGSDSSLEYLLMQYNMQTPYISSNFPQANRGTTMQPSSRYITLDSFPKLKSWYLQHQACIASTLSGLARGDPVHQVVDRLLAMMMRKTSKGGSVPTTPGASANNSGADDFGGKPLVPAWDLLAAVPFCVDALLTACGHGKLYPRDLTTGLRDLVDFFPASLASVVSYLAAEVTRGLWKPALMNGKDWPSPSLTLQSIEAEIKDMLAATGVSMPSSVTGCISGTAPVSLPLPLAALVSLTITFKLDKLTELVLGVAGPALQSAGGHCPWPCMPVVAALWAQKVRRWHDYIVFAATHTIVRQDKNAFVQLLRCCFAVTRGTRNSSISKLTGHGGVGALLGHGNWLHAGPGGRHPVPPGILYLRVCPSLHDIIFVPGEILAVLLSSVRELGAVGNEAGVSSIKNGSRLRCLNPSLATTVAKMTQVSSLAASLLSVCGGMTLTQLLYTETLPTWFLSNHMSKDTSAGFKSSTALLEGYAIAYFAVLSGVLAWGITNSKEHSSRRRAVGSHMRFLATALDGRISLECDPSTWKAYILGFVALIVACTPNWILDVKVETLKKMAVGLRRWHEHDLAAALLEYGGAAAMNTAGELALG